jgi:UDP-2,3-diacylglucosamine pyrophosphatase LpxH
VTPSETDIADVLLHCEQTGLAPAYVCSNDPDEPGIIVPIASDGRDIFVVSDLHLASGRGRDGRYDGCENFFFDAAFRRFLRGAHESLGSRKAILIINGDFVDFLRVTYVPGGERGLSKWQKALRRMKVRRRKSRLRSLSGEPRHRMEEQFEEWQRMLAMIGIQRSVESLINAISDREEIYGLETDDYKSVPKLDIVLNGHPEFFEALAEWLGWGHRVIVVKGNHDLEWYWLAIRNYLRLDLARRLAGQSALPVDVVLKGTVLPNLTFIDHSIIVDGDLYIEHGHRYDPLTRVVGADTVNEGRELNIPFGSFINRYLLNFIEQKYSFIDNIRPTENILPLMLRHHFVGGIKLLVKHLVTIIKIVPRQYVFFIFGRHVILRVLMMLFVVLVGPVFLIWHQAANKEHSFVRIVEWAAWLALTYGVIQLLAYAQLKEPDSLAGFAREQFNRNKNYRLVTFGHTHNPDQFEERQRWFYNTGTWIPIVETTAANIRSDKTFMFLHLAHGGSGRLEPGTLQQWDDVANRPEPMVLIRGVES